MVALNAASTIKLEDVVLGIMSGIFRTTTPFSQGYQHLHLCVYSSLHHPTLARSSFILKETSQIDMRIRDAPAAEFLFDEDRSTK
jgi:hypothetical protein